MKNTKTRLYERSPRLPDWLHVDLNSAKDIAKSLEYWLALISIKSADGMLRIHKPNSPSSANLDILNNPNISAEYRNMIQESLEFRRRDVAERVDSMTEEEMRLVGLIDPDENGETRAEAQKFIPERRQRLIDIWVKKEHDGNIAGKMDQEQEWYNTTKVFVPPAELWGRHPGFDKFLRFKTGDTRLSKQEKKLVSRRPSIVHPVCIIPYSRLTVSTVIRSECMSRRHGALTSHYSCVPQDFILHY